MSRHLLYCPARSTASLSHGPPAPRKNPPPIPSVPGVVPAHLTPTAGCPRRSTECFGSQPRDSGQKPALPFSDAPTQPRSPPTLSAARKRDGQPPFSPHPSLGNTQGPQLPSLPSTVSLEPAPKYSCAVFAQPWGPRSKLCLP